MKPLEQAVNDSLEAIRRNLAEADACEADAYREFLDKIGGEVDNWEMLLQELEIEDA